MKKSDIVAIPLGKAENIIGNRYGKLVVLSRAPKRQDLKSVNKTYYNAECDCGNFTVVRKDHLITGASASCGCLSSVDETGNVFGNLTVIERVNKRNQKYKKSNSNAL
jgi:hypothetical protein